MQKHVDFLNDINSKYASLECELDKKLKKM